MNYSAIKPVDIADGPGVRVSLFVSGCRNCCPGCFQPETWDFSYGKPFTTQTIDEIIRLAEPDYIAGLTILGGDPMEPENVNSVRRLCDVFKELYPEKTIWVYTGYTLEKLWEKGGMWQYLMTSIDVLVDGPFVESQKDLGLRFRGSANQRIIDLNKTFETDHLTLWTDPNKNDLCGKNYR